VKTSNDPVVLNHALEQLEAAKILDPKPTYALAQSALVLEKLEHFPEAENRCQTGLLYYPAHFQSHQILSRVLIRMQRMDEAYQAFRNFVSIYPASGLRLDSILRFAIARKSFDDVDSLFASLSKEAFLTPDAERALSAAMVTCGKHFFSTGDQKRAISYFKNAVRSSRYSPKHIGEIEKFLAPLGRADLMTELLKKPSGREVRK
jgi:tetratricopeptide (TPR) repeat protein